MEYFDFEGKIRFKGEAINLNDICFATIDEMRKKHSFVVDFEYYVVKEMEKLHILDSDTSMQGAWKPSKVSFTLNGILTNLNKTIEGGKEVVPANILTEIEEKVKIPLESLINYMDPARETPADVLVIQERIKTLSDTVKGIYEIVNKSLEVKQKIDALNEYKVALDDELEKVNVDDANFKTLRYTKSKCNSILAFLITATLRDHEFADILYFLEKGVAAQPMETTFPESAGGGARKIKRSKKKVSKRKKYSKKKRYSKKKKYSKRLKNKRR